MKNKPVSSSLEIVFTTRISEQNCRSMPLALWLAEALKADIKGILIEDFDAQSYPELPWSVEVLRTTGKCRPLSRDALKRNIEHQQRQLTARLSKEAVRRKLNWHYERQRQEQLSELISGKQSFRGFLVISPTSPRLEVTRLSDRLNRPIHLAALISNDTDSTVILKSIEQLSRICSLSLSVLIVEGQDKKNRATETDQLTHEALVDLQKRLGRNLNLYSLDSRHYQQQVRQLTRQLAFDCLVSSKTLIGATTLEQMKQLADQIKCPLILGLMPHEIPVSQTAQAGKAFGTPGH